MSLETPLGLSLIKDPHLKITLKSKTSFISPLQLVSQDLMGEFHLMGETKFHHHCCAVKTFYPDDPLRNGTLTYPTCKKS
ncbi:hypothetical protein TNCV_265381 [Trichonephila clavipes]|nr:hypothetical protein TNCV_265381 [Trichonephila clavipes]